MISVSQSCMASCDGAVPSRPMPPVVYGLSSGTTALPSSGLTIGPPTFSASSSTSLRALEAAAAGQDGDLRAGVDEVGGLLQLVAAAAAATAAANTSALCSAMLALERGVVRAGPVLDVLGDRDVGDAAAAPGRSDRLVDDVVDVGRPHDALVVDGHVHEQLVEVHVLLVVRADQVVKGVAGDGQHRLAVALGVVQAVEQVDAARPGGGHADAEPAGVLGIAAGGEGGGFLVAHLDELDLVLVRAQRLEDAVDAVAGEAEDRLDAPVDQPLDQQVGHGFRHRTVSSVASRSAGCQFAAAAQRVSGSPDRRPSTALSSPRTREILPLPAAAVGPVEGEDRPRRRRASSVGRSTKWMPRPVSRVGAVLGRASSRRRSSGPRPGRTLPGAAPCPAGMAATAGRAARGRAASRSSPRGSARTGLRRRVEDAAVVQRAAQLDVLGVRPDQRHGRAGRPAEVQPASGMSAESQTCSGSRPLSLANDSMARSSSLRLASPARRQFVVGALAGQQRPGAADAGAVERRAVGVFAVAVVVVAVPARAARRVHLQHAGR